MRSWYLVAVGGVLLAGMLFGCAEEHRVRIAADNWPGNGPLSLAEYLRYYQSPDYTVDINQLPSMQAIKKGLMDKTYDGGTLTLVEAMMLKDRGCDVEILFPLDYSNGADGLVGQADVQSIADLRGKRVGAELGTVSHYFLMEALEHAGLSADEVDIVNVEASQSASAFAAGEVDACATWEPALSGIVRKYKGNLLFTSADIPGAIVDVLVVRTEALREHPKLAMELATAWDRAMDYIDANDSAAVALMAADARVTPEEFRQSMKGLKLLRSDDMTTTEMAVRCDTVQRFLVRKGMVARKPDALALVPNY